MDDHTFKKLSYKTYSLFFHGHNDEARVWVTFDRTYTMTAGAKLGVQDLPRVRRQDARWAEHNWLELVSRVAHDSLQHPCAHCQDILVRVSQSCPATMHVLWWLHAVQEDEFLLWLLPVLSIDRNECASQPCRHGTCVDGVNGFKCLCFTGYTGRLCREGRTQNHRAPSCSSTDERGGGWNKLWLSMQGMFVRWLSGFASPLEEALLNPDWRVLADLTPAFL